MEGVAEGWSREGNGGEGWISASDEAEGWVVGWASGERREAPRVTVDPWRQRDDGGLSGESFADVCEARCAGDGHAISRHDWVHARVRDQPGEEVAHLSHTCVHEPLSEMAANIGEHEAKPIVVNDDWDESALAEIDSVERAALAGPLLPPQQQPSEWHLPHKGRTLAQSFDARQIQTWEYPESSTFPVRKYQFDIAAVAVRHNTLVSLPTGLGKTLIAAVVIHNLLRWFPAGRAVFIAPTKPLVHQQIRAVRHVLGLQAADVVELTGSTAQMAREELWRCKRIIFATPQVLMNDLKNGTCPGEEVVCLVVDEAHKAVGNAAVKQAVDLLFRKGGGCRILGLSATPGSNIQMIQQVREAQAMELAVARVHGGEAGMASPLQLERARQVVRNLRISKLEARDEASVDVVGCFHQRATRICKCDLPEEYLAARDAVGRQYAHWLRRLRAVGMVYDSDPNKVTKFTLVQLQQKLNTEPPDPARMAAHTAFLHSAEFSMAIMMASAYEQIVCYGSGACLAYLQQQEKVPTDKEGGCKRKGQLVRRLKRDFFAGAAFVEMLALVQRCAKGISHPKIVLTAQLLHEHFAERQHAGRAIVFTSYRNAVDELLQRLQSVEGVKASAFIGQNKGKGDGGSAKGMPQKEQRACLKHFTSGTFNVLVATTIGEEGLDIGEVDLIIQFDAIVSPIRTTQRSGRTGRKRDGEVIMLMTPGYEEAVYERAQSKHTAMRRAIQSTGFDFFKPQSALVPIGGLHVVRRDFQAELCNPTPTAAPPSIKRGAKGGAAVSSNKQTRHQDPVLVARVLELGRAGKGLRDIDAQLHADGFLNSKGKAWPQRSDGSVLKRILDGVGASVVHARATSEAQAKSERVVVVDLDSDEEEHGENEPENDDTVDQHAACTPSLGGRGHKKAHCGDADKENNAGVTPACWAPQSSRLPPCTFVRPQTPSSDGRDDQRQLETALAAARMPCSTVTNAARHEKVCTVVPCTDIRHECSGHSLSPRQSPTRDLGYGDDGKILRRTSMPAVREPLGQRDTSFSIAQALVAPPARPTASILSSIPFPPTISLPAPPTSERRTSAGCADASATLLLKQAPSPLIQPNLPSEPHESAFFDESHPFGVASALSFLADGEPSSTVSREAVHQSDSVLRRAPPETVEASNANALASETPSARHPHQAHATFASALPQPLFGIAPMPPASTKGDLPCEHTYLFGVTTPWPQMAPPPLPQPRLPPSPLLPQPSGPQRADVSSHNPKVLAAASSLTPSRSGSKTSSAKSAAAASPICPNLGTSLPSAPPASALLPRERSPSPLCTHDCLIASLPRNRSLKRLRRSVDGSRKARTVCASLASSADSPVERGQRAKTAVRACRFVVDEAEGGSQSEDEGSAELYSLERRELELHGDFLDDTSQSNPNAAAALFLHSAVQHSEDVTPWHRRHLRRTETHTFADTPSPLHGVCRTEGPSYEERSSEDNSFIVGSDVPLSIHSSYAVGENGTSQRCEHGVDGRLVGARIRVFCAVDHVWYHGRIAKYEADTTNFRVHYDDGTKETHKLQDSCVVWELEQV